ncbi:hypothetical protein Vretimale_13063 [Volvox reticuliferus]|uniref:HNH nuclease domain-containing protein n=1 Tax=Volvox reticuliferus TaxID=1737510 RepID=A0A8J4GLS2_9CHLO|nr:hypothetical protein Vretifemale_15824 [Volvox reticuliferus]GIM09204.1 hypothetical protein Vretimale_13063 [Volvox reticuliferus]
MLKRCTSTGRVQRIQATAAVPAAQTSSSITPFVASSPAAATAAAAAAAWTSPRCCRRHSIRVAGAARATAIASSHRRQHFGCASAPCGGAPGGSRSSSGGDGGAVSCHTGSRCQLHVTLRRHLGSSSPRLVIAQHGSGSGSGFEVRVGKMDMASRRCIIVACMPSSAASYSHHRRGGKRGGRRSPKPDLAAPVPTAPAGATAGSGGSSSGISPTSGPAPSAAFSPVPAPSTNAGSGSGSGASKGKGVTTAATRGSASTASSAAVVVASRSEDGSDSDYETAAAGSSNTVAGNIVPFARRQPRALVLDCAYRPINVLTWYKAFHFDYFGKGEVLEYYPPPAVCTTGSGEHPLPAVLRVPQYTADMQDLCSRVACTRRNIMVRDGFCCQYCGSRRDLTLDHVHPVSKGGKETWENLVTACMRCNQKKSDRTLRELGWKLRRQPKEPTPFEIGIVAGIATSDILRPPPEWDAYIAPYRERLEMYRKAAVEAGLVNLIDDDRFG